MAREDMKEMKELKAESIQFSPRPHTKGFKVNLTSRAQWHQKHTSRSLEEMRLPGENRKEENHLNNLHDTISKKEVVAKNSLNEINDDIAGHKINTGTLTGNHSVSVEKLPIISTSRAYQVNKDVLGHKMETGLQEHSEGFPKLPDRSQRWNIQKVNKDVLEHRKRRTGSQDNIHQATSEGLPKLSTTTSKWKNYEVNKDVQDCIAPVSSEGLPRLSVSTHSWKTQEANKDGIGHRMRSGFQECIHQVPSDGLQMFFARSSKRKTDDVSKSILRDTMRSGHQDCIHQDPSEGFQKLSTSTSKWNIHEVNTDIHGYKMGTGLSDYRNPVSSEVPKKPLVTTEWKKYHESNDVLQNKPSTVPWDDFHPVSSKIIPQSSVVTQKWKATMKYTHRSKKHSGYLIKNSAHNYTLRNQSKLSTGPTINASNTLPTTQFHGGNTLSEIQSQSLTNGDLKKAGNNLRVDDRTSSSTAVVGNQQLQLNLKNIRMQKGSFKGHLPLDDQDG